MTNEPQYVPFSQRVGLEEIPPQLQVGQVSDELRRLLAYFIGLEVDRETHYGVSHSYFSAGWRRVASDIHVLLYKRDIDTFDGKPHSVKNSLLHNIKRINIGDLFNMVEFFVRHPNCGHELKHELASAFVTARAAYRIVDRQIVAIGTEEQGTAFEKAIAEAEARDAGAARKHLIAAGAALRNSDWAGSVRESINAVEAMARRLVPETDKLGTALATLEKQGHLHGGLKAAFGALYGYASDEEGVRHALVFSDEAQVDEADALFMLGACASFVSYLLART